MKIINLKLVIVISVLFYHSSVWSQFHTTKIINQASISEVTYKSQPISHYDINKVDAYTIQISDFSVDNSSACVTYPTDSNPPVLYGHSSNPAASNWGPGMITSKDQFKLLGNQLNMAMALGKKVNLGLMSAHKGSGPCGIVSVTITDEDS
jgi:hypothetical protein